MSDHSPTPSDESDRAPRRIVSLVPSLTEAVGESPMRSELVGVTQFCTHPKGLHRDTTLIGGTKDPDLEAIAALRPTHILVNDEENKPEHIAWLAERFATLTTFPTSVADVPSMLDAMIHHLGCSDKEAASWRQWQQAIRAGLDELQQTGAQDIGQDERRFVYFIWREPYMVAGPDSYISRSIELAGLTNHIPADEGARYPALAEEQLKSYRDIPQLELWLSSEPYPFRNRDIERLRPLVGDEVTIKKADGRLHSWYGYTSLALISELQRLKNQQATGS